MTTNVLFQRIHGLYADAITSLNNAQQQIINTDDTYVDDGDIILKSGSKHYIFHADSSVDSGVVTDKYKWNTVKDIIPGANPYNCSNTKEFFNSFTAVKMSPISDGLLYSAKCYITNSVRSGRIRTGIFGNPFVDSDFVAGNNGYSLQPDGSVIFNPTISADDTLFFTNYLGGETWDWNVVEKFESSFSLPVSSGTIGAFFLNAWNTTDVLLLNTGFVRVKIDGVDTLSINTYIAPVGITWTMTNISVVGADVTFDLNVSISDASSSEVISLPSSTAPVNNERVGFLLGSTNPGSITIFQRNIDIIGGLDDPVINIGVYSEAGTLLESTGNITLSEGLHESINPAFQNQLSVNESDNYWLGIWGNGLTLASSNGFPNLSSGFPQDVHCLSDPYVENLPTSISTASPFELDEEITAISGLGK